MPIYEYKCRKCGHEFEALLLPPAKKAAACPECQGKELEQLLSGFVANSQDRSRAAFKKASKAAEKTIREQKIAQAEEAAHHHH